MSARAKAGAVVASASMAILLFMAFMPLFGFSTLSAMTYTDILRMCVFFSETLTPCFLLYVKRVFEKVPVGLEFAGEPGRESRWRLEREST